MRFVNPAVKGSFQKENKKIEEVKTQYQNSDQMISTEIEQGQNVETEYINKPNFAILTSAPRSIEIKDYQVGIILSKYDAIFNDNIPKTM